MRLMKFLRKGLATVAALTLAAIFTQNALAQKTGGTLIMAVQPEPPTLASYISTSQPIGQVATKVYDGLLEYAPDTTGHPALAESWSVSADGKSITFKLRKGVQWHDGKPFTSADVQFTFMTVLSKVHPRGINVFRQLDSIDTPDAHTAIFRLKEPAPYIMRVLSGYESPILPKHVFANQDIRQYSHADKPIGTGPFVFTEWKRGQYIRLDRNKNYWRKGLPYLDRIVARFIPDPGTRTAALETGEVHMVAFDHIPAQELPRLRKNPDMVVETGGYGMMPGITLLIFDTTKPPFNKKEVRQAVSYAIDRQFIIDAVWHGVGKPATGPMHKTLPHYSADVMRYDVKDRLEIANKLLDQAGYPMKADGFRFEITHDLQPYGEVWQRMGEYVAQALAKVGIKVKLRYEDTPKWLKRIYTDYDFDMTSTGYFNFADPVIGVHRGYHSNQIKPGTVFVNGGRWSSPETDALMDKATVETDPKKRDALYAELQKKLVEAAPMVWLIQTEAYTVHHKKVKNAHTSALGSFYSQDKTWLDQ